MEVAVAGTGYVGLVTGVSLAHINHHVTCIDIDQNKIDIMNKGISPIYEDKLEDLMKKNRSNLKYTTDYKEAYKNKDVIFVGVGTPEREDGSANLDYVYQVIDQIKASINKDCVVIIKSTVPIGTNDIIEEKLNTDSKYKIDVVSNPEFLAQGTAVKDTLYASRIIIGVENDHAKKIMEEFYLPLTKEPYNVPIIFMNRKSAEMVKYASNNFLALKISFINEIANFCESVGANIEDVTKGMGYDSRIGNKFLNAGIGYGGSCFPKDTKALHWLSKTLGNELKTIKACIEVNKAQKIKLFEKFKKDYPDLKNKKVAILGVTFKPGTDDLREAPSIINTELLLECGCEVTAYDPIGLDNFRKIFKDKIMYANTIISAIKDKDVCFIFTEWPEIKNIDLKLYAKLMIKPVVYDGRNCYNLEEVKKHEIIYKSIGR